MKNLFFVLGIFFLGAFLYAQEESEPVTPAAPAESASPEVSAPVDTPTAPDISVTPDLSAESAPSDESAAGTAIEDTPASPDASTASDTSAPVDAQTASDTSAPSDAASAPNPPDPGRLATISYGTETEIAALVQTLKTEGSDELDEELAALAENTRNQKILSGIFGFFGEREKSGLEERAIRAVQERSGEANETVLAAIEYLGRTKDEKAGAVLMELLDAEERRYMNAAFRALGRAGGAGGEGKDEAAGYLIDYYTYRDPGEENQRDIISAVGETGSVKGVPFLAEIAANNEERAALRIAALDSIAKIGDPGGLDAVLACISAGDPNVRSGAVAALGPFSGNKTDRAILEAFRDSYYRTRLAAAQASRERKLVAAVPYLKYRAEQDEVPNVKDEAIRALGAIGNEEAMSILESLFKERKNSDRVRIGSSEMLIKNAPAAYLDRLIAELDEAKQKNQNALYNGFLKVIAEARTESAESVARRLMQSAGIVEKSYGLDLAVNNNLTGLAGEIKTLTGDRNESLARKARRTAEKLGIE
ncbi:MAG: HEAT repeat domain-containing protein [Treponema sp.]|jgi:HEAT repeat protein|nr:HEAT repeat domain-containing protein [Treponema sp.]